MDYTLRFYRDWVKEDDLTTFRVKVGETDLSIRAHADLTDEALKFVKRLRTDIEVHAETHPGFLEALTPQVADAAAPAIVADMIRHSAAYGVGPMATVAGAMAQAVGRQLLRLTPEVIVENGGDVFLQMKRPVKLMLYSGEESPFAGDVVIAIDARGEARGVCTSSARVGPSLSLGQADAVLTIADDAALADAAATAVANRITRPEDVSVVLEEERVRGVLRGALVTIGHTLGAFGEVQLVKP